jgi:hypothetical protein
MYRYGFQHCINALLSRQDSTSPPVLDLYNAVLVLGIFRAPLPCGRHMHRKLPRRTTDGRMSRKAALHGCIKVGGGRRGVESYDYVESYTEDVL